ncbi:MAG: group 1 truncated hemoglobin [Gammaproteobacteria bacterium]|nr:group 1 truncated hemoglobin [Gammaproteobacteria bacterium]
MRTPRRRLHASVTGCALLSARALVAAWALLAWRPVSAASASLYQELGAANGVRAISDALIDRMAHDPVTAPAWKDVRLDRVKRLLAAQICELAGGPCHYDGDSMHAVHAGLGITEAQFERSVADLQSILRARHIAIGARNRLLRLLAPMRREIVEQPADGKQ